MVSSQKGPTRHAYAWQIGPFWQDTLDMSYSSFLVKQTFSDSSTTRTPCTRKICKWQVIAAQLAHNSIPLLLHFLRKQSTIWHLSICYDTIYSYFPYVNRFLPQSTSSGLPCRIQAMMIIHYSDVIMNTMASQITSLTVVYSTVYSDADQIKHQSSASLAFVRGIHRDRWIPHSKGQLRGKCFHLMTSSCTIATSHIITRVLQSQTHKCSFHAHYNFWND